MTKVLVKKFLLLICMLTMMGMAKAQLSGNYVVGPGGDYTTLGAAIFDLGTNGASANVTFIVEDGYNTPGTLSFPQFSGDDTYTATIRPADNATNITFLGSSNGGIFRLNASVENYIIDGADPVTGNNVFTFDMGEGNFRHAMDLAGNNLTVKNCIFKIYDDNGIETPTFNGGYSDITIENCDFINMNSSSSVTIRAIWIRYTDVPNIRIENCRFYSDPSSPDIQTYFPVSSSTAFTAINNVINARADNFAGFWFNEKDETADVHHNTINLYGSQNGGTPGTVYGIRFGFGSDPISMQNNIVNISRSYPAGWTKIGISGTVNSSSDNNISILDDGQSDWGYLTSGDNQSSVLSSHPTYTFSTPTFSDEANNDLSLAGASLNDPDFRGTDAGITTDNNGASRNATVPAKGAFEHANSVADIISFTGPNVLSSTVDNSNSTIEFVLSNGSSQTFAPTIGLYTGAQGISPASGVTQNFSSPVMYTVTAEDGTQDTWTVTNKIPNTEADITSFSVTEQTGPAVIDPINRTVDIELGRDVPSPFIPTMTISDGATITTGYQIGEGITYGNFVADRTLTILSEDGLTSKDWTIRMTLDPYAAGTYTVGSGDDFENLKEAMDDLDRYGYDGDVVLEIQADYPAGVPSGVFRLDWMAVNSGSSLLIRPADDVTEVTIDMGTKSLFFVGMEDFTIDGENKLKFITTYTGYALVVTGDATIQNLEYETTGAFLSFAGGDLNMLGCKLNYTGSSISPSSFFDIRNGIGVSASFDSNLIDLGVNYSSTGVSLFFVFNIDAVFTNNVIRIDGDSWPVLDIFNLRPTGETTEVYHNTVFVEGTASGTEEITFAEIPSSAAGTLSVENNLVQMDRNPGASGKLVGINLDPATTLSLDGNNFFLQSGSHTRTYYEQLGSTLYDDSNLAAMLTAYPETSTESVSFANAATNDFYLSGASLNSQSLRTTNLIAGITDDFLSVTRSATAPSKGAYETPNNITEIFELSVGGLVGNATITNGFSTITAEVAAGTGFNLDPSFTLFPGASISPNSGTTQDFTSPVIYTVTAEDGTTRPWSVTITEQNSAPTDVLLTSADINENGGTNAIVSLIQNVDPNTSDTHSYLLVAGAGSTDNALFNIDGNVLRANNSLDHEASDTRSVRIRVTDAGGLSFEKAISISVLDVNDTPTDINLSATDVDENVAVSTLVGTMTSDDQDVSDSHTYTLKVGTPDNAFFTITDDQLLTGAVFDFETKDTYNLEIITNDGNGGTFEQEFAISINDTPDAPTDLSLDNNSVVENAGVNTVVGALSTTDEDAGETYTYSLASGTGDTNNGLFNINGNQLRTNQAFNFEDQNAYSVRIETNDGNGGTFAKSFSIAVADASEAPTGILLSANTIPENGSVGDAIGNFTSEDEDSGETYTYTLVAGTGDDDNGSFSIFGDELRAGASFDFETKNSYSIRVQTNDGNGGLFAMSFSISVTNVAEAPTDIDLSNNSIQESLAIGTTVGTLSTTDVDAGETYTYTLVSGSGDSGNGSFQIAGDELRSNEVFDFETQTSYSVRIQTDDGNGNQYAESFTINIGDVGPSITDIGLTNNQIDENNATPLTVGSFSTLGEEVTGSYTYSLVSGAGDGANSSFFISGDELRTSAVFDHEIISSFSIRVRTDDGMGSSFEKAITLTVNDINEAPTDLLLSANDIDENDAVNENIGTLSTVDEDAGSTHTYSFVSGTGDDDNGSFAISGNSLRAGESFDFETKSSYSVRIQTDDGDGGLFEEAFTIVINDVSEAPTALAITGASIDENNSINDVIGSFITSDEDAGETYTYSLVSGTFDTDNSSFNISGNQLRASQAFDFEAQNSMLVRVRTDDGNGGIFERGFAIDINDVNEAPTEIQLSNQSIDESNPVGTLIGTLSTTDEDAGDSHTYNVELGCDACDVAETSPFSIVGNELRSNIVFDYEDQDRFVITITSTDAGGLTDEQVFAIDINDLPAQITSFDLSNQSINENEAAGTSIGSFSTSGEDLSGSYTYSFATGTGDDDNASFSISGDQLLTAEGFDFEAKNVYSIRVMTDDGTLSSEEVFTIAVVDQSEAPTDIDLSATSIAENNAANDVIGTLTSVDQDAGESFSYALVSGDGDDDNASFNINGTELRATDVFDFEAKSSYSVRIETNDGNGGTYQESFAIAITNENEGITVSNPIANQAFAEGFATSTVDLSGVFTDEDGDDLTYSVSSSDASVVSVANTDATLTITEVGIGTSTITVTADDGSGLSTSTTFEVTVSEDPLGLEDDIDLQVYPNPATSFINVQSDENVEIKLYNLKGQIIKSDNGQSIKLDVRDLSSGVYMLKITNGESSTTKRIIKAN